MEFSDIEKKLIKEALEHKDGVVVIGGTDYNGKSAIKRLVNLQFFRHTLSMMSEHYQMTLAGRMYIEQQNLFDI